MAETMVERVTLVLLDYPHVDWRAEGRLTDAEAREEASKCARAAIEAMREQIDTIIRPYLSGSADSEYVLGMEDLAREIDAALATDTADTEGANESTN